MIPTKSYSFVYPPDINTLLEKSLLGYIIEKTGIDRYGKYFILLYKIKEIPNDYYMAREMFWRHKRKEFYDYELL